MTPIALLLWIGLVAPLCVAPLDIGAQPLQDRVDAAAPGDTVVVEDGTYAGPLVVDRPLVLVGRNRPHLRGDAATHVVTVTAPDVTVDGFEISRSGTTLNQDHAGILVTGDRVTIRGNRLHDVLHGIYVKGADGARIVRNRVSGLRRLPRPQRGNGVHLWKSVGNVLAHNTISHTRDGIYFSFADDTEAIGNTVHHARYGLHFMYSDDNRFTGNVFSDNVSGSALMYSQHLEVRDNVFRDNRTKNGYGLLLQSLDASTFSGNRLEGNMTGLYLENSSRNTFRQNTVHANFRGLRLTASSAHNRFTENSIRANLRTASLAGVSASNEWAVDGRGNFWGTRGTLDVDADGVSEWPHRVVDVLGVDAKDVPYVGLLASSPGVEALAFALRRAPPPRLPQIVDPRPLVRPVASGDSRRLPTNVLALTLALLGAAALLTRWTRS